MTHITAAHIEPLLAQTQCTACGYDGCTPYAEALAEGTAAINLCRPGGTRVMKNLARILQKEEIPPAKEPLLQTITINPSQCIGCTLCIQACPTDAIVGAPKQLHDVIGDDCTGCGLCLPVCPVDCINIQAGGIADSPQRAEDIKTLVAAKKARKAKTLTEVEATLSGSLKDIEYSTPDLTLSITPEMQAKMDAARAQAKHKWTTKKTPAAPKVLRES